MQEVVTIHHYDYSALYVGGKKVVEDNELNGFDVLDEVKDLGPFTIRHIDAEDDEVFEALWISGVGFPKTLAEVEERLSDIL